MEKIKKPYSVRLKPVRVHYEDIEQLVEIFHEASFETQIRTQDYSFSSIDELSTQRIDRITSLEILCTSPYVFVELKDDHAWLYASEDTPTSRGVLDKAKQLLQKRRRPLFWLTHNVSLSGVATGQSLMLFIFWLHKKNAFLLYLGIFALPVSLFWSWVSIRVAKTGLNVIYLRRKAETPTFFQRNKDNIALAVFSAIIGGLVTLIVEELLK